MHFNAQVTRNVYIFATRGGLFTLSFVLHKLFYKCTHLKEAGTYIKPQIRLALLHTSQIASTLQLHQQLQSEIHSFSGSGNLTVRNPGQQTEIWMHCLYYYMLILTKPVHIKTKRQRHPFLILSTGHAKYMGFLLHMQQSKELIKKQPL